VPRPPNPAHLDFLSAFPPHIVDLALALRSVVLQEAPDAVELLYDAYTAVSAGYSFTGRPGDSFVYVAAFTSGVNLGFHNGASLHDPQRVLQGTGKRFRHIKIRKAADLENPAVLRFLRLAIDQAKRPNGLNARTKSIVRAVFKNRRRPRK